MDVEGEDQRRVSDEYVQSNGTNEVKASLEE